MDRIYQKQIELTVRSCDMYGRLRPSALLGLFQDGSEALTEQYGVGPRAMGELGILWVVARVAAEITAMPRCEDRVELTVWAGKSRTGIHTWQYRMLDAGGDVLLRGSSLWVMSDAETRSMLSPRIPKLELNTENPPAEPFPKPRGEYLPPLDRRTERRVDYSETDLNGHLNNTRYLDWICDLPPIEFHRDHPLKRFSLDFREETKPGERVTLDWALTERDLYCRGGEKFEAALHF